MKEVRLDDPGLDPLAASFLACLATILELPASSVPRPAAGEDVASGWTVSRWIGTRGLGLVEVARPRTFSWAGPWIGRLRPPRGADRRYVVLYGVPSGVIWDPLGGDTHRSWIDAGYVVSASDIAQALPPTVAVPTGSGTVAVIWTASAAGEPGTISTSARAIAGSGLDGDRHPAGRGTFPSHIAGSALTLIEAEICEVFDPPLTPDQHRRNLVIRGLPLNGLVGQQFQIGSVVCLGVRLCEPCTVMQSYRGRPLIRALVHRGGLRADILTDGEIRTGDPIAVATKARTQAG